MINEYESFSDFTFQSGFILIHWGTLVKGAISFFTFQSGFILIKENLNIQLVAKPLHSNLVLF